MTKHIADIIYQDHQFLVSGELNFYTVMSVYNKSIAQINSQHVHELHFDFSQVVSSDSAGLALIVEWIKLAKKHNQSIRFSSLSSDLHSIAKAASVDQLILE